MEVKPGIYRHYKGNEYEVLGVGKHTETLDELVFYRSLNDNKMWARPVEMFYGLVDGTELYRFQFVREK